MNKAFRQSLLAGLESLRVRLGDTQIAAMEDHFHRMVERNQVVNLTRITDPAEAGVKHYADSISLAAWANEAGVTPRTLLDIGTGAGFPSVPLAIAMPLTNVTAIDGTAKKIDFLREWADSRGVTNLRTVHAHSSHWNTDEDFDIVTARAVSKLADLIESTGRFVAKEGRLVFYKAGSLTKEELKMGCSAANKHGLDVREPFEYMLPDGEHRLRRVLHVFSRTQ